MSFALAVLLFWPVVVLILFKKYAIPIAAAWAVIAGYLFLPGEIGINLPILPTLDKDLIPALAALVFAAAAARSLPQESGTVVLQGLVPKPTVLKILFVILIVGVFMTSITNGGRLTYGPRNLPGLTVYDAFSTSLTMIVATMPFFVGRKYLADPEGQKKLLLVLCLAGLLYSLPALYEVRMSPQLQRIFYGYSISGWRTNLRGDGFRPFVFLEHGLWLAIFLSYTLLATIGYLRASGSRNRRGVLLGATIWLFVVLVLVKSLGALAIALCLAPIILFLGVGTQLMAACAIALILLTYPALRSGGIIPTERVVSLAENVDPQRASSLAFRLRHEETLLEKAYQKPLFGWGGWGRARIFDNQGRDLSVTDGRWALIIGVGGWTGYIAEFGLLTAPIILLWMRRRRYDLTLATSALALVLAANLIDLIPNATQTPITWLIAGALAGRLEMGRISAKDFATQDPLAPKKIPSYNRQTELHTRIKRHTS